MAEAEIIKMDQGLGVQLPAETIAALKLKPGDNVRLDPIGPREFAISRKYSARQRLQRLRAMLAIEPDGSAST